MDFFVTESLALSPALKDFISGAVAGAFAITVSQPLDTVRVRIQQQTQSGSQRNALGVLVGLIRQEGLLSPFKGLTYPLLFASVQSAILFQAYGWTLRQLAVSPHHTASHEQRTESQPQQPQQPHPASNRFIHHQHHQHQHASLSHLSASAPTSSPPSASLHAAAGPQDGSTVQQWRPAGHFDTDPHTPPHLHQVHLHHHHHQSCQAEQQAAAVHGSHSVTGQVLAWVAAQAGLGLGPPPPPPPPVERAAPSSSSRSNSGAGVGPGAGESSAPCETGRHCAAAGDAAGASGVAVRGEEGGPLARVVQGGGEAGSAGSAAQHLPLQQLGTSPHCGGGGRCPEQQAGGAAQQEMQQQQQQVQRQHQQAPLPTPWNGFLAGGVAGLAQVFLWSPVELLKLRAQLQTATPGSAGYRNPAALAAQVLRQDGVAGLYRGFTLTVVRDVPSYAMYFWLYHDIAGALSPGVHPEQAPPSTQVLAGGLAGVIAWLPIYPLDVLKTRVQAVTASASRGKGWAHYAREMYAEAGARAFFRGIAPTLVRAFMMDGASFLGYTTTLRLLGGGSEEGRGQSSTDKQAGAARGGVVRPAAEPAAATSAVAPRVPAATTAGPV